MNSENYIDNLPFSLDKANWKEVLSACVGKMLLIQSRMNEHVVKSQNWSVNFSKGTITFGKDEYPVQLLGSESYVSDTWLWGWEDINNTPENVLELVNRVYNYGEKWALAPLTTAYLNLTPLENGFTFSIVSCGLEEDYGIYRCPYDKGDAFVAVENLPDAVISSGNALEISGIINQSISTYELDHKILVCSLLNWNKTPYNWEGQTLTAQFSEGKTLTVEFESAEGNIRVKSMSTSL